MAARSPPELYRRAKTLYTKGNPIFLAMQIFRPFICPFGELLDAVPEGARVMDIGCGGGLFLGLLAAEKQIESGLGFDVSAAAIITALEMRKNHPRDNVISFEHRNAGGPWPDGKFDVVSMVDVIHHIAPEHRRETILRACAHVRPGGILLYKDMVSRPRWRVWSNTLHDLLIAGQWTRVQDLQEVMRWCADAGLDPKATVRSNMLWYGHEMVVFRKKGGQASYANDGFQRSNQH